MKYFSKLQEKLTSNKISNLSVMHRNYLLSFIVVLILLRIFYINTFSITQHLLNIVLIFAILFMIFKNIKCALKYTALMIVIYLGFVYYVMRNNYGFENFENEDGSKEDSSKEDVSKEVDEKDNMRAELDALIKKFEAQHKSGKNNIDTSKLEKYTDRLKGKIELKDNK